MDQTTGIRRAERKGIDETWCSGVLSSNYVNKMAAASDGIASFRWSVEIRVVLFLHFPCFLDSIRGLARCWLFGCRLPSGMFMEQLQLPVHRTEKPEH